MKQKTKENPFRILNKLYELNLLSRFRREKSAHNCPKCEQPLPVFTHPSSKTNAFFLCQNCAYFHPLPAVYVIIKQTENGLKYDGLPNAINNEIKKIKRAIMPAGTWNKYRFQAMKERQKHAREQKQHANK